MSDLVGSFLDNPGYEPIVVDDSFIESMDVYRQPMGGSDLISKSFYNPSYFSERMIGVRPYAWQVFVLELFRRAVEERARYLDFNIGFAFDVDGSIKLSINGREIVIITSRQIGKSRLLSLLGIWLAVFNKAPQVPENSTNVIVISASDTQAKKLLNEMKKILRMGDRHMASYKKPDGSPVYPDKFFSELLSKNDSNSATQISFDSYKPKHGDYLLGGKFFPSSIGSTLKSYPPTSSVLGEAMSVVFIDEAGKTERVTDSFFEELYPVGDMHFALRGYTSTPWSSNGFFYRMVDPDNIFNSNDYVVVSFDITAIRIENPKIYNKRKKDIDRNVKEGNVDFVNRAYYCRFVKGESSYFIPDRVKDVFDKTLYRQEGFKGPCNMGVDFGGQTTSKTVVTISSFDEDSKTVTRLYEHHYGVQEDDNLIEDIAELRKRFNIQDIIVDDCSAGMLFIRLMEKEGWNVTRMSFRAEKVKKYGAFRKSLNLGLIKSYPDDALKTEMMAMEYSGRSKQSVIQHAPGYSDDLIDSFVMSAYYYCDEDVEDTPRFFSW